MFDAGVCGPMERTSVPQVCVNALRELQALIGLARRSDHIVDPVLQAEHHDLSLAGGAHAIDSEAAAGNSTDAVPAVSQRAELGSDSIEVRSQVLRLLARLLRDHVARQHGQVTPREDRDE
jgi:hypothetical protein